MGFVSLGFSEVRLFFEKEVDEFSQNFQIIKNSVQFKEVGYEVKELSVNVLFGVVFFLQFYLYLFFFLWIYIIVLFLIILVRCLVGVKIEVCVWISYV